MKTTFQRFNPSVRSGLVTACFAVALGLPLLMSGCDKTESKSSTKTTTTKESPEKTVKTTETTEKKVVTDPK